MLRALMDKIENMQKKWIIQANDRNYKKEAK